MPTRSTPPNKLFGRRTVLKRGCRHSRRRSTRSRESHLGILAWREQHRPRRAGRRRMRHPRSHTSTFKPAPSLTPC